MKARFSLTCIGVAVATLAAMVLLDVVGIFMYFTYIPAYALALVIIAARIIAAGKTPLTRWDILVFLASSAILVAAILILPGVETSPRKGFYLAWKSLRPGMAIDEVKAKLRRFDQSPHFRDPCTYSFGFVSAPRTTDVIVVHCDPTTNRVVATDYSPD